MRDYDASTYGDRIAPVYDEWVERLGLETDTAVELLAALAGGGPVLELAIGTGRIALPLVERGVEVHGIDASEEMVARLRAKPRGSEIPVTIGDFADVAVPGPFSLVFVAFNTFFALLTQDDQVRCFANVAARLADGGVFVVEAFVPDLGRFDRGQRLETSDVDLESIRIHASRHDPVGQRVFGQTALVREDGIRFFPVELRYAYPPELDLMARLAGLRLRERFGGWEREPFTAASGHHVSIYERA